MYQQHFEEYNKLSTINSLLCQIQYTLQAKGYDGVYFIVDKNVFRYYQEEIFLKLQKIEEKIVLIEADELYKNQAQCQKVWSFFVQKNVSRRALVIIIGGGITLDLGAFACSTWKRGVAFILVPSTLLAMADACIGGKTGINFQGIKNLVGTFAFPQEIWIAPELLKTLPARIFRCGLSEIFKTALVADLNLWNKICSISEWKGPILQEILFNAIVLKKKIVEQDPFENGLRKVLNFGHTLGHALEALSVEHSFSLLHGEAVAIGIILESYISYLLNKISEEDFQQVRFQVMKHQLCKSLPLDFTLERLQHYLIHDKKNYHQNLRFSLLEKIGKGCYDVAVDWEIIKQAFENYRNAQFI